MTARKPKHLHKASGQPTKYKDEYCELVVKLAKKGFTHVEIAAHIGIAENTLYNWRDDNPKFLRSLKRAKTISKANLMQKAYVNLESRDFNTNLLKLILSHNYKDTSKIKKLTSTTTLDKISEVFQQYEDGFINIETAERASKLLAFQLDEETRKKVDLLCERIKDNK